VLTIAGGEALYADMGHFGRRPIAVGWYTMVLPSLLLNYAGQGAYLLGGGNAGTSTFYAIVPQPLLWSMVVLATLATVIASQALISGAYSLTQQAIQLGYFPRLRIVHTSAGQKGQIYVPFINGALMVACVALVLGFGASSRLAAAYGLAVSGTMTITSVAFFVVLVRTWHWPTWRAALLVGIFLVIDLAFLVANLEKFFAGGWVPVGIGVAAFVIMITWIAGRKRLSDHFLEAAFPIDAFVEDLARHPIGRVRGTGVFMTANIGGVPPVLLHHVKHNQVLHEHVVVLTIMSAQTPFVTDGRLDVTSIGAGVHQVVAHFGFMETPNVPALLASCGARGLGIDLERVSYYLGRETLIPSARKGLWGWQKRLFAFIARNAQSASGYFGMPPNRVVELGIQVEI
jgi:KUP system potassium uptake protein